MSDSRNIPKFGEHFWADRKSEKEWHYCKYCYEEAPTFILIQGNMGDVNPTEKMRCCWQCGSGLEIIYKAKSPKRDACFPSAVV